MLNDLLASFIACVMQAIGAHRQHNGRAAGIVELAGEHRERHEKGTESTNSSDVDAHCWHLADILFAIPNVRYWPKAGMASCTAHVCYWGGKADMPVCTAHVR
jgi:hypothetical protein